ncbi:hypothetical protein D3C81_1235810 [compost metagenome]
MPPIPEPTITPRRSLFIMSKSILEFSIAICAAAIAYCENLSVLLISFLLIYNSPLKSLISAATLVGMSETSTLSILLIPLLPSFILFQNSSVPIPTDDTTPIPVITTRFFKLKTSINFRFL